LNKFEEKHNRFPNSYDLNEFKEIAGYANQLRKGETFKVFDLNNEDCEALFIKTIAMMSMTNDGQFGPQDAYIGGLVAQEAIKAITGKFMPITQ